MFGNYKQLFNEALNKTLPPTSMQCAKHPSNKLVYVCISDSCNTPICIRCEEGHTRTHLNNRTLQKYISYSEFTRTRQNSKESLGSNRDESSQLICKLKEEKRIFSQMIDSHFQQLENMISKKNPYEHFKRNSLPRLNVRADQVQFSLQTDRKSFLESLKTCVYLGKSNQSIGQLFSESHIPAENENNYSSKANTFFTQRQSVSKPMTAGPSCQYRPLSSDRSTTYNYQFPNHPSPVQKLTQPFANTRSNNPLTEIPELSTPHLQQFSNRMSLDEFDRRRIPEQSPENNTISKLTDSFWKREEPDRAYYQAPKNKVNTSQEFIRASFGSYRNL